METLAFLQALRQDENSENAPKTSIFIEELSRLRAFRFHGTDQEPRLEEVPRPLPASGEALLRVHTVGVCGSDLHILEGHTPVGFTPITLGHEIAADVVELGEGAAGSGVAVGDRVFVNPVVGCGACEHCALAETNLCPDKRIIGIHRDGCLAEFGVAPVANLTVMPDDIDPAEIALIESAGTANHALRELGLEGHERPTIALIGAGGLGSQVLQLALWRGMRVIVLDASDQALERAARAGASATLNSVRHHDPLAALLELAGSHLDGVVDCVGFPSTTELGLSALKPGRTLSIVGIGGDALRTTPPAHFIRRSLKIAAIYAYTARDIADVCRAVVERAVTLSDPSNRRFALSDIDEALALFSDKRQAPARVLIEMSRD